jgi:hypothetical protein
MKNIFNPVYRQDYFEGYSKGLNPYLAITGRQTEAYIVGFNLGRADYERMNGEIVDGIPRRIVTNKVLEDFLLAGMLGMRIDCDYYTSHQLSVIDRWYQSGIEKYDPNESIYLLAILEKNSIEVN